MKVLVTGAAGFIGSHLSEALVMKGHTVVCFDNMYNGSVNNIRGLIENKRMKLVIGDVRDKAIMADAVRDVDAVVHLAAQIHVDRSLIEPEATFDINVLGTLNALELCRKYDVRMVVASSSEVYGSALSVPMNENHPLNSPHPYGASKIAADRLCYSYIQTYGSDITILRAFNAYGPRQKDTGYGGAISIFIKRVLTSQPPLVYGNGKQTRDYTYISDLVRAYVALVERPSPLREVLNAGTGREVSIISLANLVVQLAVGKGKIQPVHVAPRPGEVQRLCCDSRRIKELLGWEAKVDLASGLKELIEWYKSYRMEEWEKPG